MNPLTPEDLQSGAVRAVATDLLTGQTQELTTRPGSICQFFEPFVCGGYRVGLRLHWKDPDGEGNPMLDADFYDLGTNKMDKSMKKHPAHHTMAQGHGDRTYEWEFADESRKLRIKVTWSVSVNCTVSIADDVVETLTRAGKHV